MTELFSDFNVGGVIGRIGLYAVPLMLAITVHEFCHGYVADKLGDPTPRLMGRLTLNPIPHIDPIGSIIFPLVLFLIGSPFMLAWAKPVPINPLNFKRPYKGLALSSIAGPLSNLALGFIFIFLYKVLARSHGSLAIGDADVLLNICRAGIWLNFALFAFNLFPVPPLDGGHALIGFLPRHLGQKLEKIEPYGFIILMVLLFTNVVDMYLRFVFTILSIIIGGMGL